MPAVYLCILFASILSVLSRDLSYKNLIIRGISSVAAWHIFVNFSVWFSGGLGYSLFNTYLFAIPFDLRLLISTLVFSTLFYGLREMTMNIYSRFYSNS
jgi:hypothetical protein